MRLLSSFMCAFCVAFLALLYFLVAADDLTHAPVFLLRSVLLGLVAGLYVYFRLGRVRRQAEPTQAGSASVPEDVAGETTPPPDRNEAATPPRPALSEAEREENARKLRAMMDDYQQRHASFGEQARNLKYPTPLPLSDPAPDSLPEGQPVCSKVGLYRHRWEDGRFSFSLEGRPLPVAIYKREKTTISRTRETEEMEGYAWRVSVPSLQQLVEELYVHFQTRDEGQLVARLYQDQVVHSTGLTTTLYLILDPEKSHLEIQYFHHFDGE